MTSSTARDTVAVATLPWIDDLASGIRRVLRRDLPPLTTARHVADLLGPLLGRPGLLTAEQEAGDPRSYRQHLLHACPDSGFSIVALVWLPGQHTAVHDHVCWCVAGVHQGVETEQTFRPMPGAGTGQAGQAGQTVQPGRLIPDRSVVNPTGALSALAPPGDIHRVGNTGPGKAISLHIYGADLSRLGSSIRRVYPDPTAAATTTTTTTTTTPEPHGES
ncbi:cysteine dioxygenase family protein [Streptacidiphilus fuscans]|uniref:Cysteine dioxygenase family protein n=1 Tax=Streptacidiphilus fuscans TaxID=2789292 RepID=A0A931AZZ9_9ACTN|nr:cysteine dioxygenase family protein [Streptacidiphilus fuscans]MBF9068549.1 cysteine dioxygenase family protein [Streptacidiphilus fuscans]